MVFQKLSKYYEKIRSYYDSGLWDKKRIQNAVIKEWITKDEYYDITNELFVL